MLCNLRLHRRTTSDCVFFASWLVSFRSRPCFIAHFPNVWQRTLSTEACGFGDRSSRSRELDWDSAWIPDSAPFAIEPIPHRYNPNEPSLQPRAKSFSIWKSKNECPADIRSANQFPRTRSRLSTCLPATRISELEGYGSERRNQK